MSKIKPYSISLLAAITYSLGHPNLFDILIPVGPIIGTILLFLSFFKTPSILGKLKHLFIFNLYITLFSFYWIANTLVEFGQIPYPLAILLNGLYLFLFNPYNILFLFIIHFLQQKDYLPNLQSGFYKFSMALLFALIEYIFPQQFPILLGQPWIIFSEYLGLASWWGLFGFSFISYLLVFEIISIIKNRVYNKLNLTLIILFIFLNPVIAHYQKKNFLQENKTSFNARIVQANISNYMKTSSEQGDKNSIASILNLYMNLSSLPSHEKIDLILWPETAYPYNIRRNKQNIENTILPSLFYDLIYRTQSDLAIGSYDHYQDAKNGLNFQTDSNAAFFIQKEGKLSNVYQKHILIPFGETLPFGALNKYLAPYLSGMAFFKEGESYPLFRSSTKAGINFMATICYELLKPEYIRSYLAHLKTYPHFLINMTNDSWYGDTVEPEQHLFLTKWRAIEFRIPIIRSTNTGISVFIDQFGKELKRMDIYQEGVLDSSIALIKKPRKHADMYYAKYGIWAFMPFLFVFFIFHLILLKLNYE